MKIAVFSSASREMSDANIKLAENLGHYLVEKDIELITGGCIGLPSIVAKTVFVNGGKTTAYYPDVSEVDLIKNRLLHNNDIEGIYSEKKFYDGFTKRSIKMIEDADAAIVFNGRFGTLSEFTVAAEERLPVGVIEGTGGISDEIRNLCTLVQRDIVKDRIIFAKDYKTLIDKLLK